MLVIINSIVIISTSKQIYENDEIAQINDTYDIGMVLGCGIKNNKPSLMLKDRLDTAIKLYEEGIIKNILISGDEHDNYSEVKVMKNYLLENNINEEVILEDKKGYNTSQSMINYKDSYLDKSLIIITQKYHMYRSLYISKKFNLDSIGVSAKNARYYGQFLRDIREIVARCKDFLQYLF